MRIRQRPPPVRFLVALVASLGAVAGSRRRNGPRLPSWDFTFEWMMAALRRTQDGVWRLPAEAIRRHQDGLAQPSPALRDVRVEEVSAGGLQAAWFEPPDAVRDAVLLYVHGGSFQFDSLRTHAAVVAEFALRSGVTALAIRYRLAPEHPYPAAGADVETAWRWLVTHHVPSARIVLAGDSAGGNLCLGLLATLRDRGEPLPAAAVLLSPWLDLACTADSYARHDRFDFGSRTMLCAQARTYAGTHALDDPALSPLHADLHGMPPLFVQYGSAELLHDECASFVDRAAQAGVDVTRSVLQDMPHAAPLFAALHSEAMRGLVEAARFVRERLAAEGPSA